MTQPGKFILGSGSPRRLELLGQLGIVPDAVRPPDIDEDPLKAELPRPYVRAHFPAESGGGAGRAG